MTISGKARRLLSQPPRASLELARRRGSAALDRARRRRWAERSSTYSLGESPARRLRPLFTKLILPPTRPDPAATIAMDRFADGWFDVLGSGWVSWQLAAPSPVASDVTAPNQRTATRLAELAGEASTRIDWHSDRRNGHRWDPKRYWTDITYGPGMDVKVPWELGRLQHLPQFALASAVRPELWATAQGQLFDFLAANPPWFGVNWSCAMDVGIRVANISLAINLAIAQGLTIGDDIEVAIAHAIVDHGRFVRANLEWHDRFRSNHYLADIIGLLFAGASLEPDDESVEWVQFASRQLFVEAFLQFDRDGANAEGSTCYHRLSSELLAYGTALALATPGSADPPDGLGSLLQGAARFSAACTGPDGRVIQVGDNDSGRLFQLAPVWSSLTVAEARERYANLSGYDALPADALHPIVDSLDHRHLRASLGAVCPDVLKDPLEPNLLVEHAIVRALANGRTIGGDGDWAPLTTIGATMPRQLSHEPARTTVLLGGGLLVHAAITAFPAFGLVMIRSDRLFLAFRCGPLGQRGRGGHAHNDQLSFELWVDDEPWLRDPGTYTYTADPATRNRYRSSGAHATPMLGRWEPYGLEDLFALDGSTDGGRLLYARTDLLVGELKERGRVTRREIHVLDDRLEITDRDDSREAHDDITVRTPDEAVRALLRSPTPFSPGYGWQLAEPGTGP